MITFTPDTTPGAKNPITVGQYRSPALSQAGYVQALIDKFPTGWASETDLSGGGLYKVFSTFSALLAYVDGQTQSLLAAQRIQTCQQDQIVSWVADFLGPYLPKYDSESFEIYRARVLSALKLGSCTLDAIQNLVNGFYEAIAPEFDGTLQNISFDNQGSFDNTGGMDNYDATPPVVPTVTVWDKQSNPTDAATYGIAEPQFVLQFGTQAVITENLAYDSAGSFDNTGAFDNPKAPYTLSTTAPDPRLGDLINLRKATGTKPMYLVFT